VHLYIKLSQFTKVSQFTERGAFRKLPASPKFIYIQISTKLWFFSLSVCLKYKFSFDILCCNFNAIFSRSFTLGFPRKIGEMRASSNLYCVVANIAIPVDRTTGVECRVQVTVSLASRFPRWKRHRSLPSRGRFLSSPHREIDRSTDRRKDFTSARSLRAIRRKSSRDAITRALLQLLSF